MTRGTRPFTTRLLRCPACKPIASEVRALDGSPVRGWVPEATYVGYLATTPFEGYKPVPTSCPACSTPLVPPETGDAT